MRCVTGASDANSFSRMVRSTIPSFGVFTEAADDTSCECGWLDEKDMADLKLPESEANFGYTGITLEYRTSCC